MFSETRVVSWCTRQSLQRVVRWISPLHEQQTPAFFSVDCLFFQWIASDHQMARAALDHCCQVARIHGINLSSGMIRYASKRWMPSKGSVATMSLEPGRNLGCGVVPPLDGPNHNRALCRWSNACPHQRSSFFVD